MPKQKAGTRRITIIIPDDADPSKVEHGAEAARAHMDTVEFADLSEHSWVNPVEGDPGKLVAVPPAVTTRWTRERNLTVVVP